MKNLKFGGKRSGRTQMMIDELVDAVVQGQPRSVVVGHTMQYAIGGLLPRVANALKEKWIPIEIRNAVIIVDRDQSIEFTSPILARDMRGKRNTGFFWDHFSDGIN